MLSFILSKMNMLIFATAIFAITLLMVQFTGNIELKNVTASNLNLNAQIIEEQLVIDSSCSWKSRAIPDTLRFGLNNSQQFFYELRFSTTSMGDFTALILSINEYGKDNIIDAKRIITSAEVILIDPAFIATGEKIAHDDYRSSNSGAQQISLYPRLALRGDQIAAPNSFVALKRVDGDQEKLYIIPCSTAKREYPSNCIVNVLRVGCYELQKEFGGFPSDDDKLDQCFDISRVNPVTGEELSGSFTWIQCGGL